MNLRILALYLCVALSLFLAPHVGHGLFIVAIGLSALLVERVLQGRLR